MSVTLIIIIITAMVSIAGFQQSSIIEKGLFIPYDIQHNQSYWRFISHGFIHADWQHLIFNMLTLYFFGRTAESAFLYLYGSEWVYLAFYLGALVMSSLPSYAKHKDNRYYRALGASGAVASVLFLPFYSTPGKCSWFSLLFLYLLSYLP